MMTFMPSEYNMAFLMGLDESFTATKGQVLLIDLISHINMVFALVSHEENQRSFGVEIGGQDTSNIMAMEMKPNKKDKPYFKHCKILGHTIDKCFKLHDAHDLFFLNISQKRDNA